MLRTRQGMPEEWRQYLTRSSDLWNVTVTAVVCTFLCSYIIYVLTVGGLSSVSSISLCCIIYVSIFFFCLGMYRLIMYRQLWMTPWNYASIKWLSFFSILFYGWASSCFSEFKVCYVNTSKTCRGKKNKRSLLHSIILYPLLSRSPNFRSVRLSYSSGVEKASISCFLSSVPVASSKMFLHLLEGGVVLLICVSCCSCSATQMCTCVSY